MLKIRLYVVLRICFGSYGAWPTFSMSITFSVYVEGYTGIILLFHIGAKKLNILGDLILRSSCMKGEVYL